MTKEQLESNTFTKYAAGLMQDEELRKLEEWLKKKIMQPSLSPTSTSAPRSKSICALINRP
jgi:hypothetical protein